MRITCPHCGERWLEEFTYRGDASVTRPAPSESSEVWTAYVYLRSNRAGAHREFWYHGPCHAWLVLTRDVRTHEVLTIDLPIEQAAVR